LWYDKNGDNLCAKGGAHLGHVFDYGPKPAGVGYCISRARCARVCVRMPSVFFFLVLTASKKRYNGH
jgi:SelR domain